ncbi:uncharacterized protein LOC126625420 [Malus sylvestris]|uniref:uncharacterized protein LOC126625420 n=1 Tax=Malus sylvestris TaxID=3752 RepID=UPI0021AC0E08|nr:uncharacterized protein LOC126625420 [Malus sylvestris]
MAVANEFFKENVSGRVRVESMSSSDIIKWRKPPNLPVKINFDGSIINSVATGGFMIRNELGNPLIVGALNLGQNTINVVEPLALREAICWATSKNLSHIIIESDSKLIIDYVQGKCEMPWNLRSILEDVKWCVGGFQEVKWCHIFRETNFMDDALASVGIKSANLCISDACIPFEAKPTLLFDTLGTGCTRG